MTRKPDQYRSAAECLAHVDELTAADPCNRFPILNTVGTMVAILSMPGGGIPTMLWLALAERFRKLDGPALDEIAAGINFRMCPQVTEGAA